ncbi:hypothetical protein Ct9H90mP29_08300 [bacterium]|nr:MAG: hypothetical protein Ct9H90mP29_08300 [bacterium]
MAEVTNTPWDKRHSYVIDKKAKKGKVDNLAAGLKKKLHVSHFGGWIMNMNGFLVNPKRI